MRAGLKPPAAAVARALLVVLRRGRLRAAEEVTAHTYETSSRWLRRAAAHADTLPAALVHALHLNAVEGDAFWSLVRGKGGRPPRATTTAAMVGSGGGAGARTAPAGAWSPGQAGAGRRTWPRRW